MHSYSDGLALIKKNGKRGYIDMNGVEIILCNLKNAYDFKEGLAKIKKNRKFGFIDKLGNLVIKCDYPNAWHYFTEGLVGVKKYGKWGFINSNNEVVVPFKYKHVKEFKYGLTSVSNHRSLDGYGTYGFYNWGLIDKNGKELLKCEFNRPPFYGNPFYFESSKIYTVEKGFINEKGVQYWED